MNNPSTEVKTGLTEAKSYIDSLDFRRALVVRAFLEMYAERENKAPVLNAPESSLAPSSDYWRLLFPDTPVPNNIYEFYGRMAATAIGETVKYVGVMDRAQCQAFQDSKPKDRTHAYYSLYRSFPLEHPNQLFMVFKDKQERWTVDEKSPWAVEH